ncbi:adenosylcobinamide-GDP ribazoletransferase [Serinicoccus marinus]|uniref:adenosylcobinamide-GDP ribazoletransferase n=1 Tax=Serinicoccus marinus TaxID=247333 RepID=UPI0003B6FBE3|nr:adenosylcobinamide-GDP ribazoletransferase [Serinicoccus marinus]
MIAALRDATSFLTRVPLPQREGFDLARAAWAFPIVGAGVGAVVGALAWGAGLLVPPLVAATLAVLAEVLLTGALHLDGLADCADGCGGHDRESRLRIMKDHAVGVYGTAAVVLALVLQIAAVQALLGSLEWWGVVAVLASVGALSRSGMLTVALRLPSGRPEGTAGPLVRGLRTGPVVVAGGLAGLSTLALWPIGVWVGVCVLLAALVVPLLVEVWAERTLGGVTGDVLGATAVLTQLAALIGALALPGL